MKFKAVVYCRYQTIQIKCQRKKQAHKNKRLCRIRTEKREILWIRSPYKQIIPENYGKYYLFTFFLPLSFEMFQTKRGMKKKNMCLCAPYHFCDNVLFSSYTICESWILMQITSQQQHQPNQTKLQTSIFLLLFCR